MSRIKYTLFGIQTFAAKKSEESPIEAVIRSIEGRPGVGRAMAAKLSTAVDRSGAQVAIEYAVTICGKKQKNGGWPIIHESKIVIPLH